MRMFYIRHGFSFFFFLFSIFFYFGVKKFGDLSYLYYKYFQEENFLSAALFFDYNRRSYSKNVNNFIFHSVEFSCRSKIDVKTKNKVETFRTSLTLFKYVVLVAFTANFGCAGGVMYSGSP